MGASEGAPALLHHPEVLRPVHQAADQRAAVVIPSQLDGHRKKERLRERYGQYQPASGSG